jgi:multiple sugar transport system substrate-binding protein
MKSKRTMSIVALILLTSSLALFAGGQQEGEAVATEQVSLTYWHLWGGSRSPLVDQLIERFNQKHPEIEIEQSFTAPFDLGPKVFAAAGTNTLPDVFNLSSDWYLNLRPEKTMVNLEPLLEKEKISIENILVPAEAKRCYYDGSVYSLPNVTAGAQFILFYNRKLLQRAGISDQGLPSNWKEFTTASKKIVNALNSTNQLEVVPWNPVPDYWTVVGLVVGNGAQVVSNDSKTAMLNTPGAVEVVEAYDDYVEEVFGRYGGYKGLVEWSSRVRGADTGAQQIEPFIKEKQVFYISGSWTVGQVRAGNPDMDLQATPVPGLKGPQGGEVFSGWAYGIGNNTKHPEAAWEFLKFITLDEEGNGEFCKSQKRPCPIASVNKDPAYDQELGELWASICESMNLDMPTHNYFKTNLWALLFDIPNRRISGQSVSQIMEDINKEYQDFLNDTWSVVQ